MKSERLFRILGLVDDDLIEEAAVPASRRRSLPWRRITAAAACLAVLCGAAFYFQLRMGGDTAGDMAGSAEGWRRAL